MTYMPGTASTFVVDDEKATTFTVEQFVAPKTALQGRLVQEVADRRAELAREAAAIRRDIEQVQETVREANASGLHVPACRVNRMHSRSWNSPLSRV